MSRRERNLLLAVDDEADFLDLIEQIGQGVGCSVIKADSAASFRELLGRRQPSLILLDLQMPGMDGIEALRYLARMNVTSGILLARNCSLTSMVSIGNLRGRISTASARDTALPASSWAETVIGELDARFQGRA